MSRFQASRRVARFPYIGYSRYSPKTRYNRAYRLKVAEIFGRFGIIATNCK